MGFFLNERRCQEKSRGISQEIQVHILSIAHRSDQISLPDYLFSETYCGGYSGEDPPLPIPNREVKLTIADGTAPPGGRVGSCHFLIQVPDIIRCRGLLIYIPLKVCGREFEMSAHTLNYELYVVSFFISAAFQRQGCFCTAPSYPHFLWSHVLHSWSGQDDELFPTV